MINIHCIKKKKFFGFFFFFQIFALLPKLSRKMYNFKRNRQLTGGTSSLDKRFHALRTMKSSKILFLPMIIDTAMSALWIILACLRYAFYKTTLDHAFRVAFYNDIPLQVCCSP